MVTDWAVGDGEFHDAYTVTLTYGYKMRVTQDDPVTALIEAIKDCLSYINGEADAN